MGGRSFCIIGNMRKEFIAVLVVALLAGCSGTKKSGSLAGDINIPPDKAVGAPPAFALPGVPLKSEIQAAPAAAAQPAAAAPAAAAAETAAAETAPAQAAAAETGISTAALVSGGDLDFHLRSARRYAARKQYRSAAAEYGAALPFLPAGDARAVQLLERQGAMLLRVGDEPKAREQFLAAINKAKEISASGNDLANSYLGLGYCQEKARQVPEAISSYEKAMELSVSKTIKARIAKTISDLKKNP